MITAEHAIRIARPSADLAAAERFCVGGLGLSVLYRAAGDPGRGEHDLLMVGPPNGRWHLELTVGTTDRVAPSPAPDDLLVIYLAAPVSEQDVARAAGHGGTVVRAQTRTGIRTASPSPTPTDTASFSPGADGSPAHQPFLSTGNMDKNW